MGVNLEAFKSCNIAKTTTIAMKVQFVPRVHKLGIHSKLGGGGC